MVDFFTKIYWSNVPHNVPLYGLVTVYLRTKIFEQFNNSYQILNFMIRVLKSLKTVIKKSLVSVVPLTEQSTNYQLICY